MYQTVQNGTHVETEAIGGGDLMYRDMFASPTEKKPKRSGGCLPKKAGLQAGQLRRGNRGRDAGEYGASAITNPALVVFHLLGTSRFTLCPSSQGARHLINRRSSVIMKALKVSENTVTITRIPNTPAVLNTPAK